MQSGGWKFCLQPLKQYPNCLSHDILSSQCPHLLEQFAPKYPSLHSFGKIERKKTKVVYILICWQNLSTTKVLVRVQKGYEKAMKEDFNVDNFWN